MNDLTTKTDQKLEEIIRRAENTHISGSLYQRAKIELELRDSRKRREKRELFKLKPKEWYKKPLGIIFLTIIAGVLVILITNILGLTQWPNKNQSFVINKNLISPTPVDFITPKEITDTIDSAPPLQQDTVASNYEGVKVSWLVYLGSGSVSSSDKNLYTVTMKDEGSSSIIVCDIDLNSYPQLKIIKKDQIFTVEGEIYKVNSLWINLIDCKLLF